MRKHWWLTNYFLVFVIALPAQSRLAVFMVGSDTLNKLPCIDIDFFNSMPSEQLYGPIGDHFEAKYVTTGHTRFDKKAKADLLPQTGIGYFGMENEPVSAHYHNFLKTAICSCNRRAFNDDSLYALQDKVWTYNVLDALGYIDSTIADQQPVYTKAREQFNFEYGLTDLTKDSTASGSRMTLLSKASQIYYTRKYATRPTEKPDNLHFTDSSIVYRQLSETHTINNDWHQIAITELEPYSLAIKDAIYQYLHDYCLPPERMEVIKWADNPVTYIVTFSTLASSKYVMRVKVGEDAPHLVGLH